LVKNDGVKEMKKISKYFLAIKKCFSSISLLTKESTNTPLYRVVSIEKNDDDTYSALVQKTNSMQAMKVKPEEILANDRLTDSFSQQDIRTLTYLGYLGINSPKYKILAKRLSKKESTLIYVIKEKGRRGILVKTAEEISTDNAFLEKLDQKDAHDVGYSSGAQGSTLEKQAMKRLLKKKSFKKPGGKNEK
jgi:hypothetical protein